MKMRIRFIAMLPALIVVIATDALPVELRREDLMAGAKIPERREFPESNQVGPCEDFHKFVCERTESGFRLPADRSAWNFAAHDNSERLLHAKKAFFRKVAQGFSPKGERIAQVTNYYRACMDRKARRANELTYIASEKKLVLSVRSNQALQSLSASRIDQSGPGFLHFQSTPDQRDPTRGDVVPFAKLMTLPERSYYENAEAVRDLESLVEAFFRALRLDRPKARARWVVDFEMQFAQREPIPALLRDRAASDTYRPRAHFLSTYPNLKLDRFFARIPEQTRIRDFVPETTGFVNDALESMPLDQLKSVLLFQGLEGLMEDAYSEYLKMRVAFRHKHLGRAAQRAPRDERCTGDTMEAFGQELDEYLLPILFPSFPRDKVVAIVDEVRNALLDEIARNAWLSEQAKKEAQRKIETAKLFLVQPANDKEWNFNPVRTYSRRAPVENSMTWRQAQLDKTIEELKFPRLRERWEESPLTLGAYYSPPDNKFVLLQGYLQPPYFDPAATEVENLASLGTTVGHELGHALDDKGSRYDAEGRVRQWMTAKDLEEFRSIGDRLVARFNAIGHNGVLTLGENIGDNVGLHASYRAAFSGRASASRADKQAFFKAHARNYCGVATPGAESMLLKTEVHALGRARINEQVIHLDGFHEAFACKKGDRMFLEPAERIKVW